jgi:hypothetical protein
MAGTQQEVPVPEADDAVISVGAIDVNKLCGELHVETTQEPYFVAGLLNRFEQPGTKVVECKMADPIRMFVDGDFKDLTPTEKTYVACNGTTPFGPSIAFYGHEATHEASNGKWLTVMEFLDAVGKHETATRGSSDWFGGVDTHHVCFEGVQGLLVVDGYYSHELGLTLDYYLPCQEGGPYSIAWGS